MPVDQESSLFTMTPEQHRAMVEQQRQQFMAERAVRAKERELFQRLATVRQFPIAPDPDTRQPTDPRANP